MSKKTYRFKYDRSVLRTDGVPTHCCSCQTDYFAWEKNTKYNNYNGWSGYVAESVLKEGLEAYNPDNLTI